jgi:ligand-binding sensor domain-containing protein/serine phosphatase RsbU (regulator of sigma subunit)
MNQKFAFIISLTLLIFSCSQNEEELQLPGPLYGELPKDTLAIDTIVTGVEFDFSPDTVLDFVYGEKTEAHRTIKPLKRQNVFDKKPVKVNVLQETDTVFGILPDTVKAEPLYAYLSHPQPVEAGEMALSKYSTENIQTLGIDQGLSSPFVYAIVEDQFGFMWFAQSTGLTRYDGKYLFNYTTDNGLISNEIWDLFIAPDGRMWITSNKGLMVYNGQYLEIYTTENGLTTEVASGFRVDKDGNLWFICRSGGVLKYDGEYFYQYTAASGLTKDGIFSIGFDQKNQLLISPMHTRHEILNVEENYIVRYKNPTNKSNHFGSTMTMNTFNDNNGELWTVSYNGGVRHVINDSITHQTKPLTGVNYLSIVGGLQDSRGNYWFCMQDGGICYDNGKEYIGYTEEGGLNSNIVVSIMEDSKGNIWAGTSEGVAKIVPESFKNMTSKDGLSDQPMVNLGQSPTGHMLITNWADGMYAFDGKRFERYQGGGIVFEAKPDYFGNVVIGIHQGGIQFFIPSYNDTVAFREKFYVATKKNPVWNTRATTVDPEGNLWGADDVHGLSCYKLNEDKSAYAYIEKYRTPSGLINNNTRDLYIDKNGTFWLAYMGDVGVSTIKGGKIQHHNTNSGFPSNYISQFYEDSKGNFWMCSDDGLILKESHGYHVFTTTDGLSDNGTRSIIEDNKGRIWIGTKNGLNMMMKKGDGPHDYTITSFGVKDGLAASAFGTKDVFIDSTNTIWWITSQSLISLNLDAFEHSYSIPEVTITDISIMTDHINFVDKDDTSNIDLPGAQFGETRNYFNVPEKISLPHNYSSINIKYGSLGGNPIHHLNYRYWLKGFHKDWVKPSDKVEAEFTNLPPGKYDFQVQAKLANNDWGPTTSYQFEVRPPFWQRWWFRVLIGLLAIYLVYMIVRARNKQLRKRKEELEYTVKQRTMEIEQQKEIIEEKQIEILDSINYAQRIQKSLMATDKMLDEHLKDYFVYFQPKDIVSGDFYWATPAKDGFLVVNADSTGHGVPGAIMSMLNISCLEKATESGLDQPAEVLDFTRKKVIETLAKDGSAEGGKDGMDCSLVKYDIANMKITFAAAHNGIWIVRGEELIEYKADKMPVGKHHHDQVPFSQTEVELQKGDIVYTFTDGYPDQFGGEKGKKFKYKSLKKLLIEFSKMPMKEQGQALSKHFEAWKGDLEQLDDVCIIGVKI